MRSVRVGMVAKGSNRGCPFPGEDHMSILYSVHVIVSSTNTAAVSDFIDVLSRDGWGAHAQTDDFIFPEFYLMQGGRVTSVGNVDSMTSFASKSTEGVIGDLLSFHDEALQVKRKLAELHGLPEPELPAGDFAPCPCDSVAIVKAVAAGRVPLNWGRAVIDRYYEAGLRFCVVVYRMDPYQCFPPVVMYSSENDTGVATLRRRLTHAE
jgi:hypothetical protein